VSAHEWVAGDLVRANQGKYIGQEGVVTFEWWGGGGGGRDWPLVKFPAEYYQEAVPPEFLELTDAGKSRRKVAEFVKRLGPPTVKPEADEFHRYQWWQNGHLKEGWIVEINITPDWIEIYGCGRMYAGPQIHLRVPR